MLLARSRSTDSHAHFQAVNSLIGKQTIYKNNESQTDLTMLPSADSTS